MATAPTPGARSREARVFFRIRIQDRTLELSGAPTIKEKMAVRFATGLPLEAFIADGEHTIGEDSIVVLWWLARRQNGEPNLPFNEVANNWPTLGADDIDVDVIDLDSEPEADDSPEGSGPA